MFNLKDPTIVSYIGKMQGWITMAMQMLLT